MAATVSTVPAVLGTLVRRFGQAVTGATVSDGPPINEADDLIMVGFTGEVGEPAVQSTMTREQLAAAPNREQYDVSCVVSSWKGVEDDPAAVKATRDRAYEMVNAMAADLARDPRLDELVLSARLSTGSLAQYYTNDGVSADVVVVISVDAFTRRI